MSGDVFVSLLLNNAVSSEQQFANQVKLCLGKVNERKGTIAGSQLRTGGLYRR
jgi:hypothetical protein